MKPQNSRSGAVLLLVLCILLLLSVIAVAFLLSSSDHYLLAKGYSRTTQARLLADSACQLAIGQIQTATGVNTGTLSLPPLWFSQPGLIRTIDSSGTHTAYKLYSAPTMVVSASSAATAFNPESLTDLPTNWSSDPNNYVDINAPVTVNSSVLTSTQLYPIVDPSVNTTAGPPSPATAVQGFWYTNANSSATADNVTSFATTSNPLPMPVRWLYVLQDGSLVTLDSTGKAPVSTSNNPIVGRLAFWTDDETCKININTACGDEWNPVYFPPQSGSATATDPVSPIPYSGEVGVPPGPPNSSYPNGPGIPIPGGFTSQPYNQSNYDYLCLYLTPPMNHEFQRYPGHPAATYLSAVFPTLNRQQLAQLAPRVAQWSTTQSSTASNIGSNGGTNPTVTLTTSPGNGIVAVTGTAVSPAITRLYESVDELQYAPVSASPIGSSPASSPYATNSPRMDLSQVPSTALQPILTAGNGNGTTTGINIQPLRFFLTAHSVAPELNVFGRPRVSIWPLSAKVASWSAFDKLAGFCSTLGTATKSPFFVARYYPKSSTGDASVTATAYGFSNAGVFTYLQSMMSQTIPGHAQSLTSKFNNGGNDAYQILTEILDYIRCTNLNDPNVPIGYSAYSANGNVAPLQETVAGNVYQGFGREPVINRLTFIYWIMNPAGSAPNTTYNLQCMMLPELFNPMMGQVPFRANNLTIQVVSNNLSVTGTNSGAGTVALNFRGNTNTIPQAAWGENDISSESLGGNSTVAQLYNAQHNISTYPFLSQVIPLTSILAQWNTDVQNAAAGATANDGVKLIGNITVQLTDNDTGFSQTYKVDLTGNGTPLEARLPSDWGSPYDTNPDTSRLTSSPNIAENIFLNSTNSKAWQSDSAVSVEVSDPNASNTSPTSHAVDADYRFISLSPTTTTPAIPTNYFQPHYLASAATVASLGLQFDAATFAFGSGAGGMPDTTTAGTATVTLPRLNGSLVEYSNNPSGSNNPLMFTGSFGYNQNSWPDFPTSLNSKDGTGKLGALLLYGGSAYKGDWDSGVGHYVDGAFANKADEGGTFIPYGLNTYNGVSPAIFTPNREVSSPVTFGSLPTGFKRGQPWQTLLFCPDPASRTTVTDNVSTGTDTSHPGFADPPDHLLLDLFDMPVVEPYAISQPFATAGKVNLNYQMVPFTYIHRDTALRAVLRSTMVTAVPTQVANCYKHDSAGVPTYVSQDVQTHYPIDLDTTLSIFDHRFAQNLPFQTASEFCSMYLFPAGIGFSPTDTTAPSDLQAWWNKGAYGAQYNVYNFASGYTVLQGDNGSGVKGSTSSGNNPTGFALTGDNLREQPYNQIYSRLTTQSNSYTVHVWAQTLTQSPTSKAAGVWNNNVDQITGEYRGSYLLERYLNPSIASYSLTSPPCLNNQYKMRIVSSRVFAP